MITPELWQARLADLPGLSLSTALTNGHHHVHVSGELDFDSGPAVRQACLDGDVVVVDMSDLTFMDCAGYGYLAAARIELEQRGGSLTLTGSTGEPARLLTILGLLLSL